MTEPGNELAALAKLSPEQLTAFVAELIDRDFSRLVQLLYRLDVSEDKLKNVLLDNPEGDAAAMIARLVMERMEQSRKSKEMFPPPADIPEDEKW
jgi:hypothetical protein